MKLQKTHFGEAQAFTNLVLPYSLAFTNGCAVLCHEAVEDAYEDKTEFTEFSQNSQNSHRQKLTHAMQVSIQVLASTHPTPMKIMPNLPLFNLQHY